MEKNSIFSTEHYPHFCLDIATHIYGSLEEPGWYFWDETQAYYHGPFASLAESEQSLVIYCSKVLGV